MTGSSASTASPKLEERLIRSLSEGILSNSKEFYKAYEGGFSFIKLQAEVEGL